MKRYLMVLLLSCIATAAMAEEPKPEKAQAAKAVLEAGNTRIMLEQARDKITTMAEQNLLRMVPEGRDAMMQRYMERVENILDESLDWPTMKERMLAVYTRTFTLEELKDMAAFYRTPTGQSIMEKMPQVMQASMQLSEQQMRHVMPSLHQLYSDVDAEVAREK